MNLQRRQLIQATAGTALLGSLGLQTAFAQALEQAHCHIAQGPLTPLFTSN